jgi:hypothetical protein
MNLLRLLVAVPAGHRIIGALVVEADEAADPVEVGLFGSGGIVLAAEDGACLLDELGLI